MSHIGQVIYENDMILHSLARYNMIEHLEKLRQQFPYFNYKIINYRVVDLIINKRDVKSARNIY